MNGKVQAAPVRTFLLPLLGVLLTTVLVAVVVRGVEASAGGAETQAVLPFGN